MSTIYGKYHFNNTVVTADELSSMEHTLNHWEADDRGCWHSGPVGFGHLMLYNTPESLIEKLPVYARKLTITADARIDNRGELFGKLDISFTEQKSIPDSMLILRAYEKYGVDCVQHLIGDFAFAIWDEKEQRLFCARDQMGVRPFYYYKDDHRFAFASEIKGLLAMNDANLNLEINESYLLKIAGRISLIYNETVYKNIFRLGPAESLTLKGKQIQLRKYWELDATKETKFKNPGEYISVFREKFEEAVRCRLRSAYPVGTELSGGLDSSGITCVAAKLLHEQNKAIACFSEVIPEEARQENMLCDEFYIDEVQKFAGIDHLEKMPSYFNSISYKPKKFLEDLDLTLQIADGPNNAFAAFSNQLKKAASDKNVRTLFSGFLGDHMVTCFKSYFYLDYAHTRRYIDFFKEAKAELTFYQALKTLVAIELKKPLKKIFRKHFLKREIRKHKEYSRNFLTEEAFKRIQDFIGVPGFRTSYREMQKRSVEALRVSTRFESEIHNGKMYKVEPCFPMADIRLLEYVLSVPTSEKMKAGKSRLLFRKAMKGRVPDILLETQTKLNGPRQRVAVENWLLRQKETKEWLVNLQKQNLLPGFIDYPKFNKAYTIAESSINKSPVKLEIFGRVPLESVIRWLEKRKKIKTKELSDELLFV